MDYKTSSPHNHKTIAAKASITNIRKCKMTTIDIQTHEKRQKADTTKFYSTIHSVDSGATYNSHKSNIEIIIEKGQCFNTKQSKSYRGKNWKAKAITILPNNITVVKSEMVPSENNNLADTATSISSLG